SVRSQKRPFDRKSAGFGFQRRLFLDIGSFEDTHTRGETALSARPQYLRHSVEFSLGVVEVRTKSKVTSPRAILPQRTHDARLSEARVQLRMVRGRMLARGDCVSACAFSRSDDFEAQRIQARDKVGL